MTEKCVGIFLGSRALPLSWSSVESLVAGGEISARSGPIRSLARTFLVEKFESSGRFPYFRRLSKLCVGIFLKSRALPLSWSSVESLVAGGEISARSGPIRSLARTFLAEKFESSGRFPYFRFNFSGGVNPDPPIDFS